MAATATPPRDDTTGKFTKAPEVTPPPVPPPAAPPEAPAKGTEAIRDFGDNFGFTEPPKVEKAKPAEQPAAERPAKQPAKPKKPVVSAAPPAAAPVHEPLTAKALAEATAQAVREALKPAPEKEPKAPDLTDEDQETVLTLTEMALLLPDKYKGLADRYIAGQQKLKDYVAKWKKEHPDQEFDQEDPEHEAFFSENDVDWEDRDFNQAKKSLLRKEVADEVRKELEPKISVIENRERERQAAGVIKEVTDQSAREFWGKLGEEFKGLVTETGDIDKAKVDAVRAANGPQLFQMLTNHATALDAEVSELRKLLPIDGDNKPLVAYDAKKPTHARLNAFANSLERQLLEKPESERLNAQGFPFSTPKAYDKMSKEQKARHWTLGFNELRELLVDAYAAESQKALEMAENIFLARAKAKKLLPDDAANGGQAGNGAPATPQETPTPQAEQSPSPSASSGSRLAGNMGANGKPGVAFDESWVRGFLHGP